jgi:hypothetical protein
MRRLLIKATQYTKERLSVVLFIQDLTKMEQEKSEFYKVKGNSYFFPLNVQKQAKINYKFY